MMYIWTTFGTDCLKWLCVLHVNCYNCLSVQVRPYLISRHYNSHVRASISAAEKLALTLRYLATGNSQVYHNSIEVALETYIFFNFVVLLAAGITFIQFQNWEVHCVWHCKEDMWGFVAGSYATVCEGSCVWGWMGGSKPTVSADVEFPSLHR